MQRRKFLRGASTAGLAAFVSTGAAAAMVTDGPGRGVPASCECDGTYDECCGLDGPCECYMK